MSRSRKKTPICGMCSARTMKWFRRVEHKRERSKVRDKLRLEQYEYIPHPKEFGNEWASPRDGKQWFGNLLWHEHHWTYFDKHFGNTDVCLEDVWNDYKEQYKELMRK